MRLIALAFVLLVTAATAEAQTVAFRVNLGEHQAVTAYPVDDDGDPATPETWLLELFADMFSAPGKRFQLVVPTPEGVCKEDPFTIGAPWGIFADVKLPPTRGRAIITVSHPASFPNRSNEMLVLFIDRVRCQ